MDNVWKGRDYVYTHFVTSVRKQRMLSNHRGPEQVAETGRRTTLPSIFRRTPCGGSRFAEFKGIVLFQGGQPYAALGR